MFLTGQFFPRPWEEPQKPKHQPKDKNYFNNKDGLWNNPHRTAKKIASFYHQKDQDFKKTHYTDQEIKNAENQDQDFQKFQFSQERRLQSRERTQNRRNEREILQFKSNQHLEEEEVDKVGDFALSEPELFDEMATKRAKSYKDPGRQKEQNMQLWNAINYLPSKQLSKILRPNIIQKDKEAAELIQQKIEHEKQVELSQKQWYSQNRNEIRQKFIERHEKNIELEQKAGIQKEYQPIKPQSSANDQISIKYGVGTFGPNTRPYSAYNHNSSTHSSKRGLSRINNLLAVQNQKNITSEGQITFRQNQQLDLSIAKQDEVILHELQNQDINYEDQQTHQILSEPQIEQHRNLLSSSSNIIGQLSNKKVNIQKSQSKHNGEFRVSTNIQPVFYRSNKTFEKLKQPKQQFEPTQPFMQQDFRGLFSSDHQEALVNCQEYDPDRHSTYLTQSQPGFGKTKRSFNTVRELFPVPQNQAQPKNLLFASNQGILSTNKSITNQYQNRSRQQFSQTRQGTPFTDQAVDLKIGQSIQNISNLYDSQTPLPLKTDPSSRLGQYGNNQDLNQVKQHNGQNETNKNAAFTPKKIAQNQAQSEMPITQECPNPSLLEGGVQLRQSQTMGGLGGSKLVKRPFTAYKATVSQRTVQAFGVFKNQFGDPYHNQHHQSFSSNQNLHQFSSRQKQKLHKDLIQAQQQLETEKDECLSQMDWFEKVNHLDVKKPNRYPKVAYEEAQNYDEVFHNKLAKKKEDKSPAKGQRVETNQDNRDAVSVYSKVSNGTITQSHKRGPSNNVNEFNHSQKSFKQLQTPSAVSNSNF